MQRIKRSVNIPAAGNEETSQIGGGSVRRPIKVNFVFPFIFSFIDNRLVRGCTVPALGFDDIGRPLTSERC